MFFVILGLLWRFTNRARGMETAAQGILTRDEMESRRLLAAQDLQRGLSQSQVARKFGVTRTTASRWCRALSGSGVEGLRKRRAPGRPSRLNAEQLRHGFRGLPVRPAGRRIRCGPLDHGAFRRSHPDPLWGPLRPRPRRSNHAPPGVARETEEPAPHSGRSIREPVFAESACEPARGNSRRGVSLGGVENRRHEIGSRARPHSSAAQPGIHRGLAARVAAPAASFRSALFEGRIQAEGGNRALVFQLEPVYAHHDAPPAFHLPLVFIGGVLDLALDVAASRWRAACRPSRRCAADTLSLRASMESVTFPMVRFRPPDRRCWSTPVS